MLLLTVSSAVLGKIAERGMGEIEIIRTETIEISQEEIRVLGVTVTTVETGAHLAGTTGTIVHQAGTTGTIVHQAGTATGTIVHQAGTAAETDQEEIITAETTEAAVIIESEGDLQSGRTATEAGVDDTVESATSAYLHCYYVDCMIVVEYMRHVVLIWY